MFSSNLEAFGLQVHHSHWLSTKAVWEEVNPDPLAVGPPGPCSYRPPPGWSGWYSVGNRRTGRRPVSPQGRVPRRQVTTSYCQRVFFYTFVKTCTLFTKQVNRFCVSLTHTDLNETQKKTLYSFISVCYWIFVLTYVPWNLCKSL